MVFAFELNQGTRDEGRDRLTPEFREDVSRAEYENGLSALYQNTGAYWSWPRQRTVVPNEQLNNISPQGWGEFVGEL